MTVEVQLQVRGVNLLDSSVQDTIDQLSDYDWSTVSGITLMTVFSDGDVVADTTRAIRCARNAGVDVWRVHEEIVNADEIARRVGSYTRQAVQKWVKHATFPAPRGSANLWDWAEVLQWLGEHKSLDLDEELPTREQVAAINAEICDIPDYKSDHMHRTLQMLPEVGAVTTISKRNLFMFSVANTRWNRVTKPNETVEQVAGRQHVS